MESPGAIGRRRGTSTRTNAEDQALDQIAREVSTFFNKNINFLRENYLSLFGFSFCIFFLN